MDASLLFEPYTGGGLTLANRVIMAPMTRKFSPNGVPGADVAEYYRRRAEADVGLIFTEGAWIPHPSASNNETVPRFYGEAPLAGWKQVVDAVHAAGGRIAPQLWHVGLYIRAELPGVHGGQAATYSDTLAGPSGIYGGLGAGLSERPGRSLTEREIVELVDAYAEAAADACRLGFDGVALHGAHGYLIDQFFWSVTNRRTDAYGGGVRERARFAAEIVAACRRATRPDFPIILRISQWKQQDYDARLAETPQELAALLEPLVDAGVDVIDASQRRFWEPTFAQSDLNLAGWAKKLTGKTTITVGSVGLAGEFMESFAGAVAAPARLDGLLERLAREEFDLIAVGRALLGDPRWAVKVKAGAYESLKPFTREQLNVLA